MKKSILLLSALFFSSIAFSSCTKITPDVNEPDYSIDQSVPLNVITPVEGENLKPGNSYLIKWDIPSSIKKVTIGLFRKGVFQENIVSDIENSGEYQWNVRRDLFQSVHYKLKICDSRYPDIYYSWSGNFYVKADWE